MPYPSKLSLAAIADAAVTIVESGGLEALGVRAVAESLSVRPTALYRYCADYDGLLSLVSEHSAVRMHAVAWEAISLALRDLPTGEDAPRHALMAMAHAYRDFAESHAALYAALVADTTKSGWHEQPGVARKALWNLLLHVVGRLTGHPDDTGAAVAVWSFLHGFAHLRDAGLFGSSGPHDGFARGITALADGLRSAARP